MNTSLNLYNASLNACYAGSSTMNINDRLGKLSKLWNTSFLGRQFDFGR